MSVVRPPFEVTIHGPRGDEWERVCGTRTFPVQYWTPIRANLPGIPNAEVYLMDLREMEPDIVSKIVAHLAVKFGMTPEECWDELKKAGIPILAKDCTVMLHNPLRWV